MEKRTALSLFVASILLFTSCEENENPIFDSVNGQTMIQFAGSSSELAVQPTVVSSAVIQVEVTTVSNSDRTITVEVDATSTATSDQYTITPIIVPAGEYVGTGEIVGNYDNLPDVGSVDLIINLTGIDGTSSVQENETFTVSLERFCPFDINTFVGTYSAVQGTSTYIVTATAGPEANTLRLNNIENRGASIDIILGLTPDDLIVVIRDDLDPLIYVHSTYGNVWPGTLDPNPSNFNQCTGNIYIEYSACVSVGCFSNRVIELTKQ